ncbi:MAG: hypothetical protein K1060chlam2_00229 [Chlamydiae bacterium]|nr:hypothetical protein [Chlamydiota bacterium]
MTAVVNYRETGRLITGAFDVARSMGFETVAGINTKPLQDLLKSVDSAWYGPKAVGDVNKVFSSSGKLLDGMTFNKCTIVVKNAFKLVSDSAAFLKFMGTLGVPVLYARVKFLGLVKNLSTIYCAIDGIVRDLIKFHNAGDDKTKISTSLLSAYGFSCSFVGNGFSALETIFGAQLSRAGLQRIPKFTWVFLNLTGNGTSMVRKGIEEYAKRG